MSVYTVFLGLGSNVGERQQFLQSALKELKSLQPVKVIWASSVYETEPIGRTDQPAFLNTVVEIETGLLPAALQKETQEIERRVGRTPGEKWGPREIDIDILLYDGLVHDKDGLTIPHRGLEKRKFVLIPLKEIAPDIVHPINGMTVSELVSACRENGRVVKTSHKLLI